MPGQQGSTSSLLLSEKNWYGFGLTAMMVMMIVIIIVIISLFEIWELGSGKLKLSLTGHISTVRGLAVSSRQPYLFSCGEDKQVKCWDLEYNKVKAFKNDILEHLPSLGCDFICYYLLLLCRRI